MGLVLPVLGFGQEAFKITHGPYLQAMGDSGVNILWTTNRDAVSWVEMAPGDSSQFYAVEHKRHFDAA